MNPKNVTGPASGTDTFSLPPRRAVSGVSKDNRQKAAVPRNVSPTRVTCVAVSSLALLMRSGESLRRPRPRFVVMRNLIDGDMRPSSPVATFQQLRQPHDIDSNPP